MGMPAARETDQVVGADTHIVLVPSPPGAPVPTPLPGHVFSGQIGSETSADVQFDGLAAATVDSVATNKPKHLPMPPGTSFARTPSNRGVVSQGSASVTINGKAAARLGDPVRSCNDPKDLETSAIVSGSGTVMIG
jgi:uncharacterized Zn-binding protein involved in type VI secretion